MPTNEDDHSARPPAASPSTSPEGGVDDDDEPLSDEDEALLRELAQWLHEDEDEDPTAIDLVIEPSPPPLTAARLEAKLDVLLRPRRRSWLRAVVSHGAVAAAAVALVQLWPPSPDPKTQPREPEVEYELDLRGGEAKTFAPASVPVFAPHSVLELKLRPSRVVKEPTEVLITACREGTSCETGVLRRLGPEQLRINEHGVLHLETTTLDVLPLAPGRWELTFEVGTEGSCLLAAPERRCVEAGRTTVEIVGAEATDAP